MIRRLAKRVVRKVIGDDSSSVDSTSTTSTVQEPAAEAESLANIEAGCQEIKERIEAGEPVQLLDVREPNETAQSPHGPRSKECQNFTMHMGVHRNCVGVRVDPLGTLLNLPWCPMWFR